MANGRELPQTAAISVFTRFRAFWNDVEAARSSIVDAQNPDSSAEPALVPADDAIRTRLLGILKAQDAEVSRVAHGPVPAAYREAHYLMAAVADEVFLRLPWQGAASWVWRPLELELYGTRCAGHLVFERIERVIAEADPANRELAAVYLIALALGFEGKFAGRDRSPIREYRRQLRQLICGDRDTLEGPLVSDCYAHTIVARRPQLLPNVRGWWWAAAVVAALGLIGSTVAWRQITEPIAAAVTRVEAGAGVGR